MVKSILHDLITLNNILEQWKHALPNFSTGIGIHSSTVLMIHNRDKLHLTRCKNSRKNHLRTLPTRPTPINETESRNLVFSKRIRPNAFLKPQAPLQPKGAKKSHLSTAFPNSPTPNHLGRQRSPEFHPKTLYSAQKSSKTPQIGHDSSIYSPPTSIRPPKNSEKICEKSQRIQEDTGIASWESKSTRKNRACCLGRRSV